MSQVRAVPVAASQLYAMPLFCLKPPHFRHHNTTASSRTIRIRGPVIMASHPRDDPEDGTDIMVAQFITLPRALLVAGVLAMAPAAFAQTPASTPSTSTQATVGATTSSSPAKVTVKQDATVKAPDAKTDSQAAVTTSKTDVKPVAKAETTKKKVASAKKETKTPVKAEAKTETKTPTTPATPAAQPKS